MIAATVILFCGCAGLTVGADSAPLPCKAAAKPPQRACPEFAKMDTKGLFPNFGVFKVLTSTDVWLADSFIDLGMSLVKLVGRSYLTSKILLDLDNFDIVVVLVLSSLVRVLDIDILTLTLLVSLSSSFSCRCCHPTRSPNDDVRRLELKLSRHGLGLRAEQARRDDPGADPHQPHRRRLRRNAEAGTAGDTVCVAQGG